MGKGHVILNIIAGSIAEELEIRQKDILLSVNGKPIEDIFDYRFLIEDEYVELEIEDADGDVCVYEIEKDYGEDVGLVFANDLMDDYHSCSNRCIFCFIDQMPPGMRSTLYFKDDDSRLSFLQGNYITLTNMKEADIDRLIAYRMEPINISVHTTDPDLRCRMLNNRFAGEVLRYIDKLYAAQIRMNGQIVLCKGVNDKEQLDRTIKDLSAYLPYMESVSVVPVGLTRYRDGLYPLEPFSQKDAKEVLECVEKWQKKLYNEQGTHFIHASDEFYLLAGRSVPDAESYDGYLQLENGVGMVRLLNDEFREAVQGEAAAYKAENKTFAPRRLSVATGVLAVGLIRELADYFLDVFDKEGLLHKEDWDLSVYTIKNEFFGERITVSGLLTGKDVIGQLEGKDLGSELLLPVNMFRAGEDYFLDDVTKEDVQTALKTPVRIVSRSGQCLLDAFLGLEGISQIYE